MAILKRYLSTLAALAFASLASVSAYYYLHGNHRGDAIAKVETTVPVVLAKRDLAVGKRLTLDDLTIKNWPQEIVGDQYFHSAKDLLGRILRSGVVSEEPLTPSKVLNEGENFTSLIPPDMRGITITVHRSNALANLLERGSLVDVIALFDNGNATPTTKVIARAARVLAVHERSDPLKLDQSSSQMEVTLMVTPHDAEWLVIGMNKATVELVIRNQKEAAPSTAVITG